MKTISNLLLLISTCFYLSSAQNLQLVWEDDFDGTELDLSNWEYQIGTGCPNLCGWGNNELQYYRSDNVSVYGGILSISAKQENYLGNNYTSSRIRTAEKRDWTYGRFEARIRLPKGQGIWPAFWMLPTDNVYGIWPNSGEIDIVELVGHEANKIYGTVHHSGGHNGNSYVQDSADFSDDFHVFSILWEQDRVRWFIDSVLYHSVYNFAISSWPFDQRFHLLLNIAVGGNWPGNPDGTTQFPQLMEVDWIRVYQEAPNALSPLKSDGSNININMIGNPVNNGILTFQIKGIKGSLSSVKLINLEGSTVWSSYDTNSELMKVDVSSLSKGLFLISLQQISGETMIKKLLIQ